MCGIAGITTNTENTAVLENIFKMTDTLRHRGPDDEGVVFLGKQSEPQAFGGSDTPENVYQANFTYTPQKPFHGNVPEGANIALGHRRLSILDLSPAGHQPMCNRDSTLWIVYNGEIYNFLELRKELESLGHRFVSHTDTEVILHAYEEWGEACLHRFNGMWAFVLYDKRKHLLFGARDRFGVKPLYYYHHEKKGIFAFASEIKALIHSSIIEKDINPEVVFDYLVLGISDPQEESFFRGIYEVPPSHTFHYELASQTFHLQRYYTLEYTDAWESFDQSKANQYINTTHELIVNAIKLRLQSEVPVGSCLSGGLDSSSIVCVINSLLQQQSLAQVGDRQKTFTASYENNSVDESTWAKIVVDHTGAAWHQTHPKASELLEHLEDLVYAQDIPFGSTSMYAQYRVMKLARLHGVTVLLDGQGSDELFTGYLPFYQAFFFEMLKNFAYIPSINEWNSLKNASVTPQKLFMYLGRLLGAKFMPDRLTSFLWKQMEKRKHFCNRHFWEVHKGRLEKEIITETKKLSSVNTLLQSCMTGPSLKGLLRYEDRNSMRFSIESRTPFADDINLIEYVFRIPSVYKIHNGWSKYLLRQSMQKVLPEAIFTRKDKIGFATPEYYWFQEHSSEFKSLITSDIQEYIDVRNLLHNWDSIVHQQPKRGITTLWRYINLAMWKKRYGV